MEPWYRKTNISEIESIGVERDLAGIPVFEVPGEWLSSTANPQERAALEDLQETGRNLRISDNTCVIIPRFLDPNGEPMITFRLLESPEKSHRYDTGMIINRLNNEMAMSLLGDWLMLGHEKVGTQALSVSARSSYGFRRLTRGWTGSLPWSLSMAPRDYCHLNGFDGPPAQLMHTPIRSVDLGVLGQYVAHMSAAGLADSRRRNREYACARLRSCQTWIRERMRRHRKWRKPQRKPHSNHHLMMMSRWLSRVHSRSHPSHPWATLIEIRCLAATQ